MMQDNRLKSVFSQFLLASGLAMWILLCFVIFRIINKPLANNNESTDLSWIVPITSEDGKVLGETTEATDAASPISKPILASENFRVRQVVLEGESSLEYEQMADSLLLEMYDIKTELFTTKGKKELKALVTWKTSRPALATMQFSKEGESSPHIIREDRSSQSHTMVLAPLGASSVYSFSIDSRDLQGNNSQSDKYTFYTGAPEASLVEVMEDAVEQLFGWAIKK